MLDRDSYSQGFADGVAFAREQMGVTAGDLAIQRIRGRSMLDAKPKKRKQSAKQRLLTEMTNKKWSQYKKGNGKKTYVQIRAMVSRSQEYKRKAKKL